MKKILAAALFLLSVISQQTFGQGDLLVSPVRIIFEGNKQKEEINVVNIGNDTTTYSVSFVQYNMNEEGTFEIIDTAIAGQLYSDKYLRVFPRKVTLAPREAQVIRISLRRAPDMTEGEYRSHLYFRAEKETAPLSMAVAKDPKLMSVRITPVFGVSIPVLIRVGEVKAVSKLSGLKIEMLQDTIPTMKFTINRTGNISVYGDITALYLPSKGKPVEIGQVKGVAVYTSISKRNFSMRLRNTGGLDLKSGKILLKFTSPKDSPYELYDQKELVL